MKQNTKEIKQILSKLSDAKSRYIYDGIELIGVFGSYAQKNADAYSDIDIAYKVDNAKFDRKFRGGFAKLLKLKEIKDELQGLLGCRVDFVSLEHLNQKFRHDIDRSMMYV